MTFLVADGVVPSNEERGYVLRRVMRRAIQQGRFLELEPGFLTRYAERVTRVDGLAPTRSSASSVRRSRRGSPPRRRRSGARLPRAFRRCAGTSSEAKEAGRTSVGAEEVFRLHDTYGFPYEMTSELLTEEGLSIEGDFEELMAAQRARGRAGGARGQGARGKGIDPAEVRAAASALRGRELAFRPLYGL